MRSLPPLLLERDCSRTLASAYGQLYRRLFSLHRLRAQSSLTATAGLLIVECLDIKVYADGSSCSMAFAWDSSSQQHCTQALENAKANDLLFWASRYNLFVLWSADRTHPWDSLPGAASYVTLEIGKQRGSDSEVSVPL